MKLAAFFQVIRRFRSVSFSLYGEDVLLSQLRPQSAGFYIDVGAYHPINISNTYKLYLKGWNGITIEPNPDVAAEFRKARPSDTHLSVGIALQPGNLIYHRFANPAENTFDAARASRLDEIGQVEIPCRRLDDVLNEHANHSIDLLNVDCEERDLDVLRSLDWERYRPTVVIVEDLPEARMGGRWDHEPSGVRKLMIGKDYGLAAQCIFSYVYIDRLAFHTPRRESTGFRLDQSQLNALSLP